MSATVAKILLGQAAEDMTASIETKAYCRVTLYNGGEDEAATILFAARHPADAL